MKRRMLFLSSVVLLLFCAVVFCLFARNSRIDNSFVLFDEKPIVKTSVFESKVMVLDDVLISGEYSRYYDAQDDIWIANVRGYRHVYYYSGLGIALGLEDPYEDIFYKQNPGIQFIFLTGENRLESVNGYSFVKRYSKDPNLVFDERFLKKNNKEIAHCPLILSSYNPKSLVPLNYLSDRYVVYKLDLSLDVEDMCGLSSDIVRRFVYDKKRPDRYYEIVNKDGCAPGYCMFTYFEIL